MASNLSSDDRITLLKAFDETKSGVKGLVDAGITDVPDIFIRPSPNQETPISQPSPSFPLIDLQLQDPTSRKKVIDEIRAASTTLGFFQVINHGISETLMQEMLDGVVKFFTLDDEEKKKWYTRDLTRKFIYNSNFDLYSAPSCNWRDTVFSKMAPHPPKPEELPQICRDIMFEYTKQIHKLGKTLLQLMSEILGLNSNHLEEMECGTGIAILLHYYPKCPKPELTLGTTQHSDNDFLTILLNDGVSGLQVLYENQWIDVPFIPGSLVVNIGDLLQLISNDMFQSAQHRVLSNNVCPRISVACFLLDADSEKLYGPIEELIFEENQAKYRSTSLKDYVDYYNKKGLDGTPSLTHLKI